MSIQRTSDGSLKHYTSIGCYPLFYLAHECTAICVECARSLVEDEGEPETTVKAQINWENPSLYCDMCDDRIESAYAEPEEDEHE
jgi:hypothetical protein